MTLRRLVALHVLVLAAALAVVPAGSAKGRDAFATLLSPLPLTAAPGTTPQVRWSMTIEGHPFNAITCFARFKSRTGAGATEGFARPTAGEGGHYSATVVVPEGGIGGIEIGVAGMQTVGGGPWTRADWLFTIVNSPFGTLPARPTTSVHRFRVRG